ncbi:MAG TPA: thermonuclease family protein [Kofleriaceae bacterium]|nr:thermonuclease family protein [Kofleriaceae bacterium]
MIRTTALATALVASAAACGSEGPACGPTEAVVARAIDGDTIELATGERVRYLMVDTPESTTEVECYGENARAFNADLVTGKTVQLRYDVECTDRFGRLLAYVTVDGQEINRILVERGYGCVLHIPPNGDDRKDEFDMLEYRARAEGRGLWSACTSPLPC